METIEIRARELVTFSSINRPIEVTAYHLYIVYTDSTGSKYILRGGPVNGDLSIVGANAAVEYTQANQNIHKDWDNGVEDLKATITTGADLSADFAAMQAEGIAINAAGYDYELVNQNSNTAVVKMIEAAGLTASLPLDDNNNVVLAPAAFNDLTHGPIDQFIDWLGGIFDADAAMPDTVEILPDRMNPESYEVYSFDSETALADLGGTPAAGDVLTHIADPNQDNDTTYSLVKSDATIGIEGDTYAAVNVLNSAQEASEAVAEFVQNQVGEGTSWFTQNADAIFAQWLASNLPDLVDGNLDVDDALIGLALQFGVARGITYIGTLDTATKAKEFITDILVDEFNVDSDKALIIADGFGCFAKKQCFFTAWLVVNGVWKIMSVHLFFKQGNV